MRYFLVIGPTTTEIDSREYFNRYINDPALFRELHGDDVYLIKRY